MQQRYWFVHIQEQTLGPLPTDTIMLMLNQNRLQFADYIWSDGQPTWQRIYEVDDFRKALPSFPKDSPPTNRAGEIPVGAQAKKVEPARKKKKATPPNEYHFKDTPPGKTDDRPDEGEQEQEEAAAEQTAPAKTTPEPQREFPKIRRTARIPLNGTLATAQHGTFKIINISEGGVFVMAPQALSIGTDLKFKLDATPFKKTFEMTGVVIRHNVPGEPSGFAVEFTRVNPAHKRAFQDYIKSKEPKEQDE